MRSERVGLVLGCLLTLSACGGKTIPVYDSGRALPVLELHGETSGRSLHLVGEATGGALGLGPNLEIEAWLRSDLWLRADLRFEDEDGRQGHEVLIWGPDTALLFDRRRGRFTELGEGPGELEVRGGAFRVQHALWLALAHWVGPGQPLGILKGEEWQARDGELGIRARLHGDRAKEVELVWRGDRLQARPKKWIETSWGLIPLESELMGTFLDAPVQLRWSVEEIPVFSDSLLDPLVLP